MNDDLHKRVLTWMTGRVTGASAKSIVLYMNGVNEAYPNVPHDYYDFERCLKMFALFPEYQSRLNDLKALDPIWRDLVTYWGELSSLYKDGKAGELSTRLAEIKKQHPPYNGEPRLARGGDGEQRVVTIKKPLREVR